ncbi:MAG TPA: SpoIID/LytB domain-containing protein [Terriglobales bacterium]|nr:SpoIID/LytB domain-containing protein [Terriglobales bacterium]
MKTTTAFLALILASSLAVAQDVRIGVFGLFRPHELALSAPAGSALVLHVGGEAIVLEASSGVSIARIRVRGDYVVVDVGARVLRASELTVTSRENGPIDFNLAVPGKITRHYRGTLEVKPASRALTAVVTMDLETAVTSVVAAESTVGTPPEALKALAVAARSYFVAGKGRHRGFDFCDTTHCQFLREPPASNTAAAQAVSATRGLVIAYQSQPLAAMYTRSCSGRTRIPAELGLPSAAYPYYSIECKYCHQHPSRWQSRLSAEDAAALHSSNESSRLRLDRRLGWSAIPSNDFVMRKEGEQTILRGVGQGHGIGLCQAGAKAMAEAGADFREILAHYYPNTVILTVGHASPLR